MKIESQGQAPVVRLFAADTRSRWQVMQRQVRTAAGAGQPSPGSWLGRLSHARQQAIRSA